jgi:hypothetical protein
MLRYAALMSAAALACSAPSIAYPDLDRALAEARCEHLARCQLFVDQASCLTYTRVIPDVSVAAAIAAHKIRYDGAAAQRCVDATAARSCDLTAHDAHIAPAACTEMLSGAVGGGDACSINTECASGTCEFPDSCPEAGCCTGACRAPQAPAAAGESCAQQRDCLSGLVCGQDGTCRAPGLAEQPCGADRECGDGLACIAAAIGPGACRALPGADQPCPDGRCADEHLRCDAASHRCVASGLPGDPCPTGIECTIYLECDQTTQRCREFPTLGMACDGSCGGESYCAFNPGMTGSCRPPLANNLPCDGNEQCASAFCEDGPIFRSCIDPYVCY